MNGRCAYLQNACNRLAIILRTADGIRCISAGCYGYAFTAVPAAPAYPWTLPRAKNVPLARFLNALSSPTSEYQKSQPQRAGFSGAADGTRTRTVSLPGDFKSPVSTDSTTAAAKTYDTIFLFYRQDCFTASGEYLTRTR